MWTPLKKVLGNKAMYETADALDGAATAWAAYSTNTEEIEFVAKRLTGKGGIIFDKKTSGSGNPATAGIVRTACGIKDIARYDPQDRIAMCLWLTNKTDIASVTLLLGTDASHHMKWEWADSTLTAATFNIPDAPINTGVVVGNGWDPLLIDYVAVFVTFDAHTDLLANGMILDSIYVQPNNLIVA